MVLKNDCKFLNKMFTFYIFLTGCSKQISSQSCRQKSRLQHRRRFRQRWTSLGKVCRYFWNGSLAIPLQRGIVFSKKIIPQNHKLGCIIADVPFIFQSKKQICIFISKLGCYYNCVLFSDDIIFKTTTIKCSKIMHHKEERKKFYSWFNIVSDTCHLAVLIAKNCFQFWTIDIVIPSGY